MTAQIHRATTSKVIHAQTNKSEKCILVSDLKMFVSKYNKERSWFLQSHDLPPEIYLLEVIIHKYGTSMSPYTSISDEDRKTILAMIATNQQSRGQTLRLRDRIVDRMADYFALNSINKSKYTSLRDYI